MALTKQTLINEFSKFMDTKSPLFQGMPPTRYGFAEIFSEAIQIYSLEFSVGSITGGDVWTLETATLNLRNNLFNDSRLDPYVGDGFNALIEHLGTFTTDMSLELFNLSTIFTVSAPTTPIDFSSIPPIGFGGDASQVVAEFADLIDAWYRTGTFRKPLPSRPEAWK